MRYQAESLETLLLLKPLEKRPTGVILTGDMTLTWRAKQVQTESLAELLGTITRSFDHGY